MRLLLLARLGAPWLDGFIALLQEQGYDAALSSGWCILCAKRLDTAVELWLTVSSDNDFERRAGTANALLIHAQDGHMRRHAIR